MLDVLYEDNHLLVVNKRAMLPTMGVAADRASLLVEAKEYVRRKYNKPGNVYLGVVSRLDAPVTGVVLLARTSKAAGRLSKQFRDRDVEKVYWAIVEGDVEYGAFRLVDFMRKDERHRRMHIAGGSAPGVQRAELEYRVLCTNTNGRGGDTESGRQAEVSSSARPPLALSRCRFPVALLEVRPITGRKHQIRVQLAHAGIPILGDRKYGSKRAFPEGIALHARRLVFEHPVTKMQLALEAPLPNSWRGLMEAS